MERSRRLDEVKIDRGIRTINHLTQYIAELKGQASQLQESIDPVARGYFSATEDDQVSALLVSYCQCRAALLDLIDDYRNYRDLSDVEDRHTAFLLAFAAALTLVDVAMFLRRLAAAGPVVRRRLNQPVPTFGISGGTYDRIQKSLVSARHAWHLYHALRYEEIHRADLGELAAQRHMQSICETITRLRERCEISLTRFAHAKLRTRGDQVLRRLGRTLYSQAFYGIQKTVSSLMADKYVRVGHQPRIPQGIIEQLKQVIQPGDVFVVRKEFAVTNYFLPGFWPHAALYLGGTDDLRDLGIDKVEHVSRRWDKLSDNSSPYVLESMKDGVRIRCWSSPLASDSCLILRPKLQRRDVAQGLARVLAHEGKCYDFDFNFERSDRMVCTEVIYRAFDGLGAVHLPLVARAGRPTLSGSDLVQMTLAGLNFDPVAVFIPAMHTRLVTGEDVATAVAQVVGSAA